MLYVDIDERELNRLARDFGASERQVQMAYNRALSRTAGTLRKMSRKEFKDKLGLRNLKALRKRIKQLRMKKTGSKAEATLWFGLNDLPVSAFKGSPQETREGAAFRGQEFPGAFVAKAGRYRSVFKRVGKKRLPISEQKLSIEDEATIAVEDNVFPETEKIFFDHFVRDLRARTIYDVGR